MEEMAKTVRLMLSKVDGFIEKKIEVEDYLEDRNPEILCLKEIVLTKEAPS